DAVSAREESALVKCFRCDPVAAPNKASGAEANDSEARQAHRDPLPEPGKFQTTTSQKNDDADTREIEPMFGHGGVQLDQIRNGQKRDQEPARAENANRAKRPFATRAKSQPRCDQQARDREIFILDRSPP